MISIDQVYEFKPSGELVTVERLDRGTYQVVLRDEDDKQIRVDPSYLVGWNSFYKLVKRAKK